MCAIAIPKYGMVNVCPRIATPIGDSYTSVCKWWLWTCSLYRTREIHRATNTTQIRVAAKVAEDDNDKESMMLVLLVVLVQDLVPSRDAPA